MAIKGIDCSTVLTKTDAAALYALGYRFVCRYLVPEKYRKHLSAEEAKILTDAGFKLLSVFETTADRAKGGAASGAEDGALALQAAKKINMPTSGIIFFAVDFDALQKDMNTVEAYLRAAAQQTEGYKIGVYGGYAVVEAMAARGACSGFWQTYSWSGGKISEHATVYQYLNGQTAAGISVDLDEAYSEAGLWNYSDTGSDLNMTIDEARASLTELDGTGGAHSAWAEQAVTKLQAAGLFEGDGKGNFGWEQCLTREALAEVLYKTLDKLGLLDKL
ncbi:S-layer homology domain-containing protein [Sporobacter termitidis DSM 10068]|uniref:S-layer homology domain-containing protein n=1 Tax=Sporobacter termitidis DSM 10068 TaxID=1123282 RepID=A0A1M5TXI5_9FIRM|nr:DUF1906 domain-containing protein [Sporobacter termitidis]SHH55330.1 S-layer homology domain-containing protein [Sporobacter termitidis DSM 10068]